MKLIKMLICNCYSNILNEQNVESEEQILFSFYCECELKNHSYYIAVCKGCVFNLLNIFMEDIIVVLISNLVKTVFVFNALILKMF